MILPLEMEETRINCAWQIINKKRGATACLGAEDDLQESVFFHCVGPGDDCQAWKQVPLSTLTKRAFSQMSAHAHLLDETCSRL